MNRYCISMFLVFGVLSSAISKAEQLDYFYVLSSDTNGLYKIATNELIGPRLLGTVADGTDLFELVSIDDELVMLDRATERAITIDRSSAEITATQDLDANVFITRRGLDADSRGIVYGIFEGVELRTVNLETGITQLVSIVTGAERVEAIAFGPGDVLYAAGSLGNDSNAENLYTIDIATGQLELLGTTGFTDVDALTFTDDGRLFGVDSIDGIESTLLQFSTIDGTGTEIGLTGVSAANGIEHIVIDYIPGDINDDGEVNLLDINPFIDAALSGIFVPASDINMDGVQDLLDVAPFVDLISCN